MIDGARRVGKSWIAEEFAKREYPAYLIIDFANVPKKVKGYFNDELIHLDRFFMLLFAAYHVDMLPRGSLLVFDEVQRFPRAREAIKYLVEDGRYHYIETGSLISINRNVRNIVIPSEERHLKMFPMDFSEFLEATGRVLLIGPAREAFAKREPVEVKSSREYSTTSLDRFRTRFSSAVAEPFVLHEKNLSVKDGVTRLPLYMAPWLVIGLPL